MSDELLPRPRLRKQKEGESDADYAEAKADFEARLAAYEAQQAGLTKPDAEGSDEGESEAGENADSEPDTTVEPQGDPEEAESTPDALPEPVVAALEQLGASAESLSEPGEKAMPDTPVTPLPSPDRPEDTRFAPWSNQEVAALYRYQSDPTKEHYAFTDEEHGKRDVIPTNNGFIDPLTGHVVQEWAHIATFDAAVSVTIPAMDFSTPVEPEPELPPVLVGEVELPALTEREHSQLEKLLTYYAGNDGNISVTLLDKMRKPGGLWDMLNAAYAGDAVLVGPSVAAVEV